MEITKSVFFLAGLLGTVALFSVLSPHVRHEKVNGRLVKAWFVDFPGWETVYYPERTVDLSKWVGSRSPLTATVDGKDDAEFNAGLTLKYLGLYADHDFVQRDGRWVLFKPEKSERYFTLRAHYRISPWQVSDTALSVAN